MESNEPWLTRQRAGERRWFKADLSTHYIFIEHNHKADLNIIGIDKAKRHILLGQCLIDAS